MDIATQSIVLDATNLREVAAALRTLPASTGDGADPAFAENLEEITLEIEASIKRSAAGRGSHSLSVIARRLRWLAWSGHSDAPATVMLLRLANEMEEGAERVTAGSRNLLPALAAFAATALAVAAWSLHSPSSPDVSPTMETATAVPLPPPAPTTMVVPPRPELRASPISAPAIAAPTTTLAAPTQPEPPVARTTQPEIALPPTIVAAPVRPEPRVAPLAAPMPTAVLPARPEPPIAEPTRREIAAPAAIVAAPAPPIAEALPPDIATPPAPAASLAPPAPPVAAAPLPSSGAVAEPKRVAESAAPTPKPASADEARMQIKQFFDTVVVPRSATPSATPTTAMAAPKHVAKPKVASAPKTRRAEQPAPAGAAQALMTPIPEPVAPDVLSAAPPTAEAPPTIASTAVAGGTAAPVSPGRDCVPYLVDTKPGEPALALACRDTQGQWRRMGETPRQ